MAYGQNNFPLTKILTQIKLTCSKKNNPERYNSVTPYYKQYKQLIINDLF